LVPAAHHPIHSYQKIPCHYQISLSSSFHLETLISKISPHTKQNKTKKAQSHKPQQFHGRLGTRWLKVGSIANHQ
jgi:hypothetical protein